MPDERSAAMVGAPGPRTPFSARLPLLAVLPIVVALLATVQACDGERAAEPVRATRSAQPLNLILVTLDTTRADALGVYGQTRPVTPMLDAIAADGVLFEQAYTASPSTLPSHSTLLTGRLPFEHGARGNAGYRLADANQTLAETLAEHGYATGAEVAAMVIAAGTGIEQGFEHFRDPSSIAVRRKSVTVGDGEAQEGIDLPERTATDITDSGLAFIAAAKEPFFLWLHYFDPHAFYAAPPAFAVRFSDSGYHAEIHYVDYELGRLFSHLRSSGLRGRTLVAVTADHGEGLGEHGEPSHSFFVFDTTMRIPLILWGPEDLPRGVRVPDVVQSADLAPTLLDWLGVASPDAMSGRSVRPLIEGHRLEPLPSYGESLEPLALFGSSALRFIRSGRWKYHHKQNPELYDLEADPRELDDQARRQPEEVARLRSLLEAQVSAGAAAPEARVEVSEDDWAMLNALGYVGGSAPSDFSDVRDIAEMRGPDPSTVHEALRRYALGWAEIKTHDFEGAREIFEGLLAKFPDSVPLLRGLISAHAGLGNAEDEARALRRAVDLSPGDDALHARLVRTLERAGMAAEARAEASAMLERDECSSLAILVVSQLLQRAGEPGERRRFLAAAYARCPDELDVKNEYAYFLATAPGEELRNPRVAERLGRELVEKSRSMRADYLDTYACALAASGRFGAARKKARQAIELLRRDPRPEQRRLIEEHLALFRERRPVVEQGGGGSQEEP